MVRFYWETSTQMGSFFFLSLMPFNIGAKAEAKAESLSMN